MARRPRSSINAELLQLRDFVAADLKPCELSHKSDMPGEEQIIYGSDSRRFLALGGSASSLSVGVDHFPLAWPGDGAAR